MRFRQGGRSETSALAASCAALVAATFSEPARALGVRTLRAFESRTAGAISIGPLSSDTLALVLAGGSALSLDRLDKALSLDVRITGAGEVAVGGGRVMAQKVAITGMGTFPHPSSPASAPKS